MSKYNYVLLTSLLSAAFFHYKKKTATTFNTISNSRQLVVVTTPNWDAVSGTMQRFQRNKRGIWGPVGSKIPIVVGKKGLGWGIGLHPQKKEPRQKQEGDLQAPAGIFKLSALFNGQKNPKKDYKMPIYEVNATTFAIEDPASKYYNRIVDAATITDKDWAPTQPMSHPLLRFGGVVIDHNNPVQHNMAGSCIFMHLWRGSGTPQAGKVGTAGCTAMSVEDLSLIMDWLEKSKNPILVQLPRQEYKKYVKKWHLPAVYFLFE